VLYENAAYIDEKKKSLVEKKREEQQRNVQEMSNYTSI
jgi:hypothetical protein